MFLYENRLHSQYSIGFIYKQTKRLHSHVLHTKKRELSVPQGDSSKQSTGDLSSLLDVVLAMDKESWLQCTDLDTERV